ncbi:DUF167 domain-containing protein [bacterium]|nr:DUF167 domain-containing protein [bacterium]
MTVDLEMTTLKIKLIPRSSRNELVGFMEDGTLKIKLSAPPVDGQANQALIKLLADLIKVPVGNINIISGKTSHNKLISITGISQETSTLIIQKHINR